MDVLLCLSGAYFDELWAPKMVSSAGASVLDLRSLEGTCCYCDALAEASLKEAIAPYGPEGRHWIDTGDYHYLSLLWMEKVDVPFDLLLLDNHPDDQAPAFGSGILSCGGWVKRAKETLPLLGEVFWNRDVPPSSRPLYISLDTDVLSPEWARTDWSQGEMTLDSLLQILSAAAANRRVIGIDICGGLTLEKGAAPQDLQTNVSTRERLLEFLNGLSIS